MITIWRDCTFLLQDTNGTFDWYEYVQYTEQKFRSFEADTTILTSGLILRKCREFE